jgi:hypothetical protein
VRFTVLLAALAVAPATAVAAEPRSVQAGALFPGVVDGGAIVHSEARSIRRFDLATGMDTVVYRIPRGSRYRISDFDAAAGRIGIELEAGFSRSAARIVDTNTGVVTRIPSGRYDELRVCGRSVKLDEVAPSGQVLVTEASLSCAGRGPNTVVGRGRPGRLTVKAYGRASTRTLVARPTVDPFLSDGPPYRSLAGDQFMTVGDRMVKVRDLSTGRTRRLRTLRRGESLVGAAVGPDGSVLIGEFRRIPGHVRPREIVRLAGPKQEGRAGAIVHDTTSFYTEPRFCGARPVLFSSTPHGRYKLALLRPPTLLASGVLADSEADVSCDASTLVAISPTEDGRTTVAVHNLTP